MSSHSSVDGAPTRCSGGHAGSEMNFFRQAQLAIWKSVVTKVSIKFFLCSEKKGPKFLLARWKILVANFSFKNQNEENVFGAEMMAIFPLMIRLNTNTLIIYTSTTEKPRRTN